MSRHLSNDEWQSTVYNNSIAQSHSRFPSLRLRIPTAAQSNGRTTNYIFVISSLTHRFKEHFSLQQHLALTPAEERLQCWPAAAAQQL